MAGPTVKGKKLEHPEAIENKLATEFNKLVDDVETLRGHVAAGTTAVVEGDLTAGKVEAK